MMEQKLDPPTYFLSSCFHLQSNYNYEISKKNSWLQEKTESVERRQSRVLIKIFLIGSFYIMEQKSRPRT